jgi:small-conductance mechanosensitive channel
MDFVETTVYGVTVSLWLTFLVFAVLVVGLVYVLKRRLARRLRGLSPETSPRVTGLAADVLHHFKLPIVILIAVYLSAFFLALPAHVMDVLRPVAVVALIVQLTIWANLGIGFWFTLSAEEKRQKDAASVTAYGVIGFLVRLVLWSLAALFVLGNLGIDVTALVAGLGIGGVAIALAVQNILGDVFCSISIVLDKPFEVGDFIVVDDQLGVVEKIGIKTTRLRSLFGEQIVFSNADLLRSRIRNY